MTAPARSRSDSLQGCGIGSFVPRFSFFFPLKTKEGGILYFSSERKREAGNKARKCGYEGKKQI